MCLIYFLFLILLPNNRKKNNLFTLISCNDDVLIIEKHLRHTCNQPKIFGCFRHVSNELVYLSDRNMIKISKDKKQIPIDK